MAQSVTVWPWKIMFQTKFTFQNKIPGITRPVCTRQCLYLFKHVPIIQHQKMMLKFKNLIFWKILEQFGKFCTCGLPYVKCKLMIYDKQELGVIHYLQLKFDLCTDDPSIFLCILLSTQWFTHCTNILCIFITFHPAVYNADCFKMSHNISRDTSTLSVFSNIVQYECDKNQLRE